MRPEEVDAKLKSYRVCVARLAHIDVEIRAKNRQIECLRENAVDDMVHLTSTINDMPRGGAISDPTAQIAVMVASGYESDEIKAIRREVKALEEEREERELTVLFVRGWLEVLTERERFIVERHTCGGQFWRDTILAYKERFGEQYSLMGLKRAQARALQKIYAIAE